MDNYKRLIDERKKQNQERSKEHLSRKLKQEAKKRINTTMIGALATFEKIFGEMFVLDKDYDDLNEEEKDIRDMWEEAREEILDKGNSQIRGMADELDKYSIEYKEYNYKFIFRKDV